MTAELVLIHNVRLVDPASGSDNAGALLIANGLIEAVNPDHAQSEALMVDGGGRILCPGIVDMVSFAPDSASAAKGGITTLALMPDQDPIVENAAIVDHVQREARDRERVRVLAIGAATQVLGGEAMAEIGLMREAGAVAFSDARRAVANSAMMMRLLAYASRFDALIIQHAEDPTLAPVPSLGAGETATRLGLAGIPVAAETIMLERDIRLVEATGGRYHAAALSSAVGVEIIRAAKARGLPVSAGVTPHHLLLNDQAVGDYRTFAKTSPPLRSETDRTALVKGVADGTIDVISSAHDPHDAESKRLPFAQAADGVVGYETLLPVALNAVHKGEADLMTVLRALTCSPADLLGLPQGRLNPGTPADLMLIDAEAPWKVAAEKLSSQAKNSAFDGLPVQGRVEMTLVGGRIVYDRQAQSAAAP